jgi:DNA primase
LYCPFHPNNRTPAGEVDKEKGTFFCFACHHVADLVELVMHVSGRTYFESIRFIKSKEVASDLSRDLEKKLVEKPKYVEYSMDVINRLSAAALSSDRAKQYFAGRHISEETMELFKLGYSEKQDMVTVPVQAPDGMPLGFVGRSVEGKDFKNTPGLPKGKTLFNIHRVKSSSKVFVVESSFDAIRLHQCGLPAVATLGSNVSNAQIELLQKYFNSIIVVADNDEAGSSMKERIAKKLTSRVSAIQLNSKYKDVGDMPDEEIKKLDLSFDNTIASMLQ